MSFVGKKILYIGVSTFSYEKEIEKALELKGAIVDYRDIRPGNGFFVKVSLRLNVKLLIDQKLESHYAKILEDISGEVYDYVFFVKLEGVSEAILTSLKSSQPSATFILYLWDSLDNCPGKSDLLTFFDKAFSFDMGDVAKSDHLSFLPLFYMPVYEEALLSSSSDHYDLCFIGTGHADRYILVKELKKLSESYGMRFFSFLYLQSRIIYFFRKLFDRSIRSANIGEFSFQALSHDEVLDVVSRSTVVVDIEHQGQAGLTMRTIEMLGCRKKIITTNASVMDYDFYDENNICVVDRKSPYFPKEFISSPYKQIDEDVYLKYSLRNWLDTIFM